MSFRLRVLGLVVLVAVSATAATAWPTLRQASQQITNSAIADRAQLDEVVSRLKEYGSQHGAWEGVPGLVQQLPARTGQRIHLVAEPGTVIVDTDTQENRTPRPLGTMTAFVEPRPVLSLGEGQPNRVPATVKAIRSYRVGALLAACLTRGNIPVSVSPGSYGVPGFDADLSNADLSNRPGIDQFITDCRAAATEPGRDVQADVLRVNACRTAKTPLPDAAFGMGRSSGTPIPAMTVATVIRRRYVTTAGLVRRSCARSRLG